MPFSVTSSPIQRLGWANLQSGTSYSCVLDQCTFCNHNSSVLSSTIKLYYAHQSHELYLFTDCNLIPKLFCSFNLSTKQTLPVLVEPTRKSMYPSPPDMTSIVGAGVGEWDLSSILDAGLWHGEDEPVPLISTVNNTLHTTVNMSSAKFHQKQPALHHKMTRNINFKQLLTIHVNRQWCF